MSSKTKSTSKASATPKAKSVPTSKRTMVTAKKANSVGPTDYTVENVRFMEGEASNYITNNPYEGQTSQQYHSKVDTTRFVHKAFATMTRTQYATGTNFMSDVINVAAAVVSLNWVAPEVDEALMQSDVRGLYQRLCSANLTFKNETTSTIMVIVNAPKTKSGQQDKILRRDKNMVLNIGPKKTRSITVGYTGKKEINFPVQVPNTKERIIFNYAVVRDDINSFTGKAFDPNESIVSLKVSVNYTVNLAQPIGYKITNSSEFVTRDLGKISALTYVQDDDPVQSGGFSLLRTASPSNAHGASKVTLPGNKTLEPSDSAKVFVVLPDDGAYSISGAKVQDGLYWVSRSVSSTNLFKHITVQGYNSESHTSIFIACSGQDKYLEVDQSAIAGYLNWEDGIPVQQVNSIALEGVEWSWGNIITFLEAAIKVVEILAPLF